MGKQKKSYINTENEVSVQRPCKYIGSFAINMMKAEERQTLMNEKLEELKNVKKGIRVVLHVTTNGIKVFDEKDSTVKMAHATMRVAFSTCSPDTRMFSYVAKSTKSSKNPSILQAHVFKTKKASHAQELSAVVSKAFRLAFAMATVKRKSNLKQFEQITSESKQSASAIEVKRRWAKREMAHGHDLSEHAERARKQHPLAMLPGQSEPIDNEILKQQYDQSAEPDDRPRNISNADSDKRHVLQLTPARNQAYESVELQIHYSDSQGLSSSAGQVKGTTANLDDSRSLSNTDVLGPLLTFGARRVGTLAEEGPSNSSSQEQARSTPESEALARETEKMANGVQSFQNNSQDAQQNTTATDEQYLNVTEGATAPHVQAQLESGDGQWEDVHVNKEILADRQACLENDVADSTAADEEMYVNTAEVSQKNEEILLPPPDYMNGQENGVLEQNGLSTGTAQNIETTNHMTQNDDINVSKDSLYNLQRNRVETTEEELLRDAYWFQPGIPREIAEEMLAREKPGSFFIRESMSTSGSYAMSLRIPKFIKESGVANILIQKNPTGEFQIPEFRSSFPSIPMLVAYYASFQDELPVKLRLSHENPLLCEGADASIDESADEAIAMIDAVLPADPDFSNFDSCDIIQQELDNQ